MKGIINGLTPLKKKFCDKLLNETDNATKACKEVWPDITKGGAKTKASRMLNNDTNVINYLMVHSKGLQNHLVKLAHNARSEQVQATCTINCLDRIMGKPIGSEAPELQLPQINVLNYYAKESE